MGGKLNPGIVFSKVSWITSIKTITNNSNIYITMPLMKAMKLTMIILILIGPVWGLGVGHPPPLILMTQEEET